MKMPFLFSAGFRFLNILGLFILQVTAAKLVSPSDFGRLALLMAIAQVVGSFSTLGIPTALVRFLPMSLSRGSFRVVRLYLQRAAGITIPSILLFAGLVSIFAHFWLLFSVKIALAAGIWTAAIAVRHYCVEALRGFSAFKSYSAFSGAASTASSIVCLMGMFLITEKMSADLLILSFSIGFSIASFGAVLWLCRIINHQTGVKRHKPFGNYVRKHTTKMLLVTGIPLALSVLFLTQAREAMVSILGLTLSEVELANYVVGLRVALFAFLPAMVAYPMFSPAIASSWKNNNKDEVFQSIGVLKSYTIATTALSALIAFAIWVTGPYVIPLVFGQQYEAAIGYAQLLAIANVVIVACGAGDYALAVLNQQKTVLLISVGTGIPMFAGAYFAATSGSIEVVILVSSFFIAFRSWLNTRIASNIIGVSLFPVMSLRSGNKYDA